MECYYQYIIHFFVLLIVGGLFCNGLFISSRGETEISPNGTKVDLWAMILYPLTKLICATKINYVYYQGEQLKLFFEKIIKSCSFDEREELKKCILHNGCIEINNSHKGLWEDVLFKAEEKYNIIVELDNDGLIKIKKQYNVFVLPSIIYKPLIGCYKCYASFWGTILFAIGTKFSAHVGFIKYENCVIVPMWILYCFCLVAVNSIIYKISKD